MNGLAVITVRLITAANRAYARKWSFFGVFCVALYANVAVLARFGLLPEVPRVPSVALTAHAVSNADQNALPAEGPQMPTSISIPAIKLSATIANPETTDIEALDKLLLNGAVRYPTSAKLGEAGNVVLFGHSSYLPVVHNQAYKTFNGIQKLSEGDVIVVRSADRAYTYHVRSVATESAEDAGIPLAVAGNVLTLATCDSFGAKTDRFVVTADFVESHMIST